MNCSYGITAQDKNRNINGSAGLLLKCNQFTDVKTDIAVLKSNPIATGMGIAASQGSNGSDCESPAGNLFSNLAPSTGYYSIFNEGGFVNYFHHIPSNEPRVYPTVITNSTVERRPTNHIYSDSCCPPNISGGGIGAIDDITLEYKLEAEIASQTLSLLIDEGDTEEKLIEVNAAAPEEAMLVRQDLLGTSPYVSDTVIMTAIQREELLNNAMLRDVMVVNPHSAKSEILMQEMDTRLNPMPEYMRDEILEGLFVLSAKELLEVKRDVNKRMYRYGFDRLLSASLMDTAGMSVDTVMALLIADSSFSSSIKQAWLLLETGDTAAALNQIQAIGNDFPLTSDEASELQQLQAFMQWISSNPAIDSTATDILNIFMQSSSNQVSPAARSLLIANHLLSYNEPYLEPDLTKHTQVVIPSKKKHQKSRNELKVYPNPGRDFIVVEHNIESSQQDGSFVIVDQAGRTLFVKELTRQIDQTTLDTRNFASGSYYINLIVASESIMSVQFVIAR